MTTQVTAPVAKTTELPAPMKRPFSIDICENSAKAFQLASALIRQGYVILKDRPVDIYSNGVAAFTCVLGEPTATGYADAQEAIRLGLELEAAEFERRVKQEVDNRIEQMKHEEAEAKRAALVAEHKRKLAELEKASAAEVSKLSK